MLVSAPSRIFTHGEIAWYGILLDIYLLGDRLGVQISNGISIGRSWWRPGWCCFHSSLGSPLVWEIWSSLDWEFSMSLSIEISIGQLWDQPGDMEFTSYLKWEAVRATESSIGTLWRRRVWFGWYCLVFFLWELYRLGDRSGDQEFDRETGSSIDQGSYGIYIYQEIAWELDRKIVHDKGLVSVASTLGSDRGIVTINIDTTVKYSSTIHKRAYQRCVYFMRRKFHLFAILSAITCVWTLGPDRVVGPYLHVSFSFLQLLPCAK